MEELVQLFDSVDPLSNESKTFLLEHLVWKKIERGAYFLEKGKVCTQLGFVKKGILRVFYCNEEGIEVTKYFS